MFFFFFSSRRRHTRYIGDWSSDVCSSDLEVDRHTHTRCDRVVSRGSPAGCRQIPEVPFPVEVLTMIQKGTVDRNTLPRPNDIGYGHFTLPVDCPFLLWCLLQA